MDDLRSHRIVRITRDDPSDPFVQIDNKLTALGIELDRCTGTDGALTALALVSAGDGVALVPSWIAALPWHDVCFKRVDDLDVTIDLAVVYESAGLSPIVQDFIEVARRN